MRGPSISTAARVKRPLLVAAACLAMAGAVAPASVQAQTVAQQRAYRLTVVCWVVASRDGNEADVQRSADALRKMGSALGYDSARTAKDVTAMASAMGVELRNDPRAMERHRAACRQLGLVR